MNSYNCFSLVFILHKVTFHVELHVLGAICLLAMTKPSSGIHPIVVGKTLYRLISRALCLPFHDAFLNNTFLLLPIQSNNQGWMWSDNSWQQVDHGPSPWLGCYSIGCGKCLQFGVKKGHILNFSCYRWGHHITYPYCSCILCIWISLVL